MQQPDSSICVKTLLPDKMLTSVRRRAGGWGRLGWGGGQRKKEIVWVTSAWPQQIWGTWTSACIRHSIDRPWALCARNGGHFCLWTASRQRVRPSFWTTAAHIGCYPLKRVLWHEKWLADINQFVTDRLFPPGNILRARIAYSVFVQTNQKKKNKFLLPL